MSPPIPPRAFPPATPDVVYANLTSSAGTSERRSPSSQDESLAPYRDDAPSLNYSQIEFHSKSGGRRPGGVNIAAVTPERAGTIYSTVDHFSTAERQRSPGLFDAGQQFAKEVQTLVQEFATSKKAGVFNKLVASKETYGAGAAARALASRLNGDAFAKCADDYFSALGTVEGHYRHTERDQLTGKAASAATLQAIQQLTSAQVKVLVRHLRDPSAVDTVVAGSEPHKSSVPSANARGAVLQTMKDFVDGKIAPRGASVQRVG